ncbi:ATP-binding protein [Novosphingobium jiangmenense]|uniref:ATP-binding protein n=1 Tax=Novosphingobium jiangmenense TaxID=2791981 RepID=A0ABS0HHH7_9SPHN|nr:ATP-binding protein [Novosphingobium jiangmenense]MBF9151713.1 ATP-binding protein [Novosphingobium jiangmenense]
MAKDDGVQEASIDAVLAAQRAYAAASRERSKFGLMVPEAFVRGIRDLGYRSNGDAIAELIDNALQAYADRIDIVFGYDGTTSVKKPTQVAVIDNGHGMEPDMIRMAVMWGGTHRENDRIGLGRYGYGLPCASVSLGRRFTVYSATLGGAWHSVRLDLDALAEGAYTDAHGDIVVPPATVATLPPFVAEQIAQTHPEGWRSGTVILIDKLDRLEWSTAQGLRENLSRQFGVTYHKLRNAAAIFVDNEFVEPIDPLFLTSDFHLFDHDDDRAVALDPVRVEVRDCNGGNFCGAITLRYAWLPPSFGSVDKTRDAVGLNANPRFAILKDFHGVIFSRNGRLIDVQTRTPWTTFINNDRYIKVELEFSATLDELFGVTTSKQQVTVSPRIWELLQQAGLPKAIEQLRGKVKNAKLLRRLAALTPRPGEQSLSERAMGRTAELAHGYQRQFDLGLRASPYRLHFENLPGQAFFRIDRAGGARTLHINTAHRFYEDIYDGPSSTQEVRTALEILLFSFGDVLLDKSVESVIQIELWSRRLELALGMMAQHLAESDDFDVGPSSWIDAV